MKRCALCFVLIALVGCGANDEATARLELERQRTALDVLQQQQAKLEALQAKGEKLRQLQAQHDETLKEIEREKTELAEMKKAQEARLREVTQKEKELRDLLAKQDANIAEWNRQNALLEQKAELARHRQPFLEEIAAIASQELGMSGADPPHIRKESGGPTAAGVTDALQAFWVQKAKYYYGECMKALLDSHVFLIPSDEEFEKKSVEIVQRFIRRNCGNDIYAERACESVERAAARFR